MFTGNKETDKIVLSQLDDYDLASVCSTNKHLSEICKDETFWRNRTLARFGSYLGDVQKIKRYMKMYGFQTWKKYYISLVDFLEKVYDGTINVKAKKGKRIVPISRKDLLILTDVIRNNDYDFISNVYSFFKSKPSGNLKSFLDDQLKKDLLNPNILLVSEGLHGIETADQIEYL